MSGTGRPLPPLREEAIGTRKSIPESQVSNTTKYCCFLWSWGLAERVCLLNLFFRPPSETMKQNERDPEGREKQGGEKRRREKEKPEKGIKEDGILTI
jgi:hypothetical protein